MTNIARFTARVHPSGKLTVGYVPKQQPRQSDLTFENVHQDYSQPDLMMNDVEVGPKRFIEYKQVPDSEFKLTDIHLRRINFSTSEIEFVNQFSSFYLRSFVFWYLFDTFGFIFKSLVLKNQIINTELGSSEASIFYQPKKAPKKKGLVGITAHARLKVENAAAILEKKYGKSGLAMTTFTIPPLSQEGSEIFHAKYSEYVKFVVRNLTKVFEANCMRSEFVYVNELQEKRYASYQERKKQGSMEVPPTIQHIHILHPRFRPEFLFDESGQVDSTINFDINNDGKRTFLDRDTKELLLSNTKYLFTADYLRKLNQRAINYITGETVSTGASIDIAVVRKSAVAYLGKYLSKGETICKQIVKEGNERILPKHWSGVTKFLHDQIQEATRVIHGGAAEAAMTHAELLKEEGYFESYIFVKRLETPREVLRRVSGVQDFDTGKDTIAFFELGQPKTVQCGISATLTSKALNDVTEFIELLDALSRTSALPPTKSRSLGGGRVLSEDEREYQVYSKFYRKLADEPVEMINVTALKNLARTFQNNL